MSSEQSFFFQFLIDPAVQFYLLVLIVAARACFVTYNHRVASPGSRVFPYPLPLLCSILLFVTTWTLIFRFIGQHQYTSESYFDDAYKDVLKTENLYFTSTQLLTWATVAVVWITHQESNSASSASASASSIHSHKHRSTMVALRFLIFGFFGAMSASFSLWVPLHLQHTSDAPSGKKKGIPLTYVLSSVVSLVAITRLVPCNEHEKSSNSCTPDTGFGSFHQGFSEWLQTLHIALLTPVLFDVICPTMVKAYIPTIPASVMYTAFSIISAAFHTAQWIFTNSRFWQMPMTDCQCSITIDLIACTILTLVLSSWKPHSRMIDWTKVGLNVAAIAMFSPAAMLAVHLLKKEWPSVVIYWQRRVAQERRKQDANNGTVTNGFWCNLGLWPTSKSEHVTYDEACERLAVALGEAANLTKNDGVLACGCHLQEAVFFKRKFGLRHITGLDPYNVQHNQGIEDKMDIEAINVRVMKLCAEELSARFTVASFDKVVALDNVYHYSDKTIFFQQALHVVRRGGTVSVTDILWNGHDLMPAWFKYILGLMGVNAAQVWTEARYRKELTAMGYNDVCLQRVGHRVFREWSFFPEFLVKNLDYAIVVATSGQEQIIKRKKVAIVGSGMAGLSACHHLSSSGYFDVDVYEANERVGLGGNTLFIGNQWVDVPPRMCTEGYYTHYMELLRRLHIPTELIETGCSFYGTDDFDNEGYHVFCLEKSSLRNALNAVAMGGTTKIWEVIQACENYSQSDDSENNISMTTFGEWLQLHFGLPALNQTEGPTQEDFPGLLRRRSPFAYMMVGSLSWMLSCTYEQLLDYPVNIVLPYCRAQQWSRLGLFERFQVQRVYPSIKALEKALLYGVNRIKFEKQVTNIDEAKIIDGIEYDAIICATEASAVPSIILGCSEAFSQLKYHRSSIYLHKDESLMPPNKKDWKCWNVESSNGRKQVELTFWLNKFFPDADFAGYDIFQTWAPRTRPREDLIIKECNFQRIVHTKSSKENLEAIEREQGERGIYYAGSYSVYGMGLLEQALISGTMAAERVLQDLCDHAANLERDLHK